MSHYNSNSENANLKKTSLSEPLNCHWRLNYRPTWSWMLVHGWIGLLYFVKNGVRDHMTATTR
jgi:hypothetical protein